MQFTERAQKVLEQSVALAERSGNPEITPAHLMFTILDNDEEIARRTFAHMKVDAKALRSDLRAALDALPRSSGGSRASAGTLYAAFIDDADAARKDLHDEFLSVEHFLLASARTKQVSVQNLFAKQGITHEKLRKAISEVRGNNRVVDAAPENKLGVLEKYARDLTQAARENRLDPVIGRDTEVRRVIQILSRRTKNNPILIGEPGVGKTAIAEGLAQRLVAGDVPEALRNRRLLSLDVASLIAGAKFRGEFEERLKAVLKAVQDAAGQVILFIDEIHTIVKAGGAEGAMDASNMLKPALARGELRCVGATTLDEYRIIEKDSALERRFQPVLVNPPSVDDTVTILRGLKERYEIHHKVRIKDAAILAAASLSDRYISDRFLPDKAIDLIDEAASRLKIQLDSVPEALDKTERKIAQLRIELAALAKETDAESLEHAAELRQQVSSLDGEAQEMRRQWQAGKEDAREISDLKERMDDLRAQLADAERRADYSRASELKYGELPRLQKRLDDLTSKPQGGDERTIVLKEEVDSEDIASVVSAWTGIPVSRLFSAERERLLGIEDELRRRVVGQDHALRAVADAIRLSRSGLKDPGRPMGTFLFLGPTGVGKTETAKALANLLFDTEKSMIRFDMSEFMEEHTVAKLIGSPPGYVGFEEGGQLTEAVRRKPYSVILFDEIEKANPKVLNILLQLLDDGRLTDSHGRTVAFHNCVVIMTSNIGAQEILAAQDRSPEALKAIIMPELLRHLRPELINRIDETVIFHSLGFETIRSIVDIQIQRLGTRLAQQDLTISLTPEATRAIAEAGWDAQFGARPLRRAIQEHIEVPLARNILSGNYKAGTHIEIEHDSQGFRFEMRGVE